MRRSIQPLLLTSIGCSIFLGCHDLTGNQALPSGTPNPSFYHTPAGALGMRNAAIGALENALQGYIATTGEFTDELQSKQVGSSPGVLLGSSLPTDGSFDERILPELQSGSGNRAINVYGALQQVRGSVSQALGALGAYDPAASPALRGELYALSGYAEILLAEFYCSGIPLSTLDFERDFTYHASSTTTEVYRDALAKLDSAVALSADSAPILNLARVLQGRVRLDLGQYDSAAAAVILVPDDFQYRFEVNVSAQGSVFGGLMGNDSVSDREGGNGLPFVSGQDLRTRDTSFLVSTTTGNKNTLFPARYAVGLSASGFAPFIVADGIEARLIRAEAALHGSDPTAMVPILNQLRHSAIVAGQPALVSDAAADLTDPGGSPGDSARVSLLFQERAYWLYLTGHRQGDLRRLIAHYGRRQDQIYPTGVYTAPGAGIYGTDVTAPIPSTQYANPLYHGCLNRAA